jgi:hypothetical protein
MKKSDRQVIFAKFGGRCAYCGEELKKGWHVDELEPVERQRKYIGAHFDGELYVAGKYVSNGCKYPERFHIDNQNPSCASCNINKHSMSLEEFRSLIKGFLKHLNGVNTQYKIAKRYGLVVETDIEVEFYFEKNNKKINSK